MPGRRIGARLAVLAGGLIATAVLSAGPAWAHAEATGSVPADGSTVDRSPTAVEIRLTEPVELAATKVSLVDGSGHVLGTGGPALLRTLAAGREDPVTLTIPLPVLPPDTYRLSWTTVSSDDLHVTAGALVFGVQRAVAPAAAGRPADPLPAWGEVLSQAAIYLGLGGWMGSMLLLFLLRTGDGAVTAARTRLLRAGAVAASAAFAGGFAIMLVRASSFGGDVVPLAWSLVTGSTAGPPWACREVAAAGMVALSVTALHRPSLRGPVLVGTAAPLALAAAVTTALLGHVARSGPLLLATDTTHILATMVWAGTVIMAGAVLLGARGTGRRALARAVLRRFGLIATAALTVLVATGLLLTGDRVASVDALLLSTYGRTLLLKITVVALGALAGLVTTLGLHRGKQSASRTSHAIRIEMVLLAGVLVLTAGLLSTHQASGPQWRPEASQAAQSSLTADDLVGTMDVRPNLPGRNFVAVSLFDSRRPAPAPVQAVRLLLHGPGGVSLVRTASPAGPNAYLLATDDLTASGPWEITVTALRPGLSPATATLTWTVPPMTITSRQPRYSLAPLTPYTGWLAGAVLAAGGAVLTLLLSRRSRRKACEDPTQVLTTTNADPTVLQAETASVR